MTISMTRRPVWVTTRAHLWPLIVGIGEDALDEGEQTARPAQYGRRAVAILEVSGMNDDAQEQAERIDEDVPLVARDLLARVKALRIDRRPPLWNGPPRRQVVCGIWL